MFHWIYIVATGEFLYGGPCDVTPTAGQAVVRLSRHPNPRTERYDDAGGMRQASEQEMAGYDTAKLTGQRAARFDDDQLLKAVAMWIAQRMNVPVSTARQEILSLSTKALNSDVEAP